MSYSAALRRLASTPGFWVLVFTKNAGGGGSFLPIHGKNDKSGLGRELLTGAMFLEVMQSTTEQHERRLYAEQSQHMRRHADAGSDR